MDWRNNKFNCSVSQTLNPTSIRDMIEEQMEITGTKEIPMIFCNPVNYEIVKQQLSNNCVACKIVKSSYVEENIITVVSDLNSKMDMLAFCESNNLFDGG